MLTTTLPDKQQTLWLHGNTLLKPMHSVMPPNQNHINQSEYAEVTQIMPTKASLISAPPEPYATVTLQRGGGGGGIIGGGGAQSDDSCVKCSASPSSSEYNAPVREALNICDVLPPPPDHPYYKPPNMASMTIRTNPVAMSPQICRRQAAAATGTGQRWPTLPPPVPRFPQNWQDQSSHTSEHKNFVKRQNHRNTSPEIEEENDYESGSVLYEECEQAMDRNFFNYGGEPTEEYYRNINMEFLDENGLEPPPDPCPDTLPKNRTKHSASGYSGQSWLSGVSGVSGGGNQSTSHNPSVVSNESIAYDGDQNHKLRNDRSPVNGRRSMRNQNSAAVAVAAGSNQASSDESESDNNRWPARFHRSRSKSGDRKFRNGR